MTYVTQAELERELPFEAADFGINDTDTDADGNTDWDTLLQDVIDRESTRVDDWLSTPVTLTTTTESLSRPDHVDGRDLPLPKRPIASVTSVTVDGDTLTEGSDFALVDETHLHLLEDATLHAWPTSFEAVTVDWKYGYDGAPTSLKEAVIRLARKALDMIETDGVTQESEGSFSYTYQPPSTVRAAVRSEVSEFNPPSYYGGAAIL